MAQYDGIDGPASISIRFIRRLFAFTSVVDICSVAYVAGALVLS